MMPDDLLESPDPRIRASARRVIAKTAKPITLDTLKVAASMRELTKSGDPSVYGPAMSWLMKHGFSTTDRPVDAKVIATADRVAKVAERGRREGWTKSRMAAEVLKVVDAGLAKSRRTR